MTMRRQFRTARKIEPKGVQTALAGMLVGAVMAFVPLEGAHAKMADHIDSAMVPRNAIQVKLSDALEIAKGSGHLDAVASQKAWDEFQLPGAKIMAQINGPAPKARFQDMTSGYGKSQPSMRVNPTAGLRL
ncbi:MAG: hypothetical protein KGI97_02035 [Alphaproteobacteria bacterium]|nr:hypothetical protein [Alphaproteobacteria bacterium]